MTESVIQPEPCPSYFCMHVIAVNRLVQVHHQCHFH